MMFFLLLLITLPNLNNFGSSCTQKNPFLQKLFLDVKQNNDMEFLTMAANVSLWVVDGDEFLNTQCTCIWLSKACHFMCLFRWFPEMKPSSHRAHSYEFSLVWIFNCSFLRWLPGHTEHRDMDCPQSWLFMCLCILFQEMKHLPHNTLVFKLVGIILQVVLWD